MTISDKAVRVWSLAHLMVGCLSLAVALLWFQAWLTEGRPIHPIAWVLIVFSVGHIVAWFMLSKPAEAAVSPARRTVPLNDGRVALNIHAGVLVQLTDHGRRCLREDYDLLAAMSNGKPPYDFKLPYDDAGGWSHWELRTLMQTFGSRFNGCELPFEPTIRVHKEDLT